MEEITKLFLDFGEIYKIDIMNYFLEEPAEAISRAMHQLIKQRKIRIIDLKSELYRYNGFTEQEIIDKYPARKCFRIYMDYKDDGAGLYVISPDKDIAMTFEMNGTLIDIVYVPFGTEVNYGTILRMKERYLPDEDKEELCRIVMLDKKNQAKDLDKINGTQIYVVMDPETGDMSYYEIDEMEEYVDSIM